MSVPTLRLTVCGSSCSIPRPGRACSSYLVEAEGVALVADLGSGAYANLIRTRAAETLDAIVITHMHADHFLDLVPMRYALKYGPRANDRRIPLYLPPEGVATLTRLVDAFPSENGADFLGDVFDLRTYDPSAILQVGEAALRFGPSSHFIPTFAVRCSVGSVSLAYSSDTAPCESVAELARGADAFICEATLSRGEEGKLPRGHSSARQAGSLAQRAEAARLVISHYPATARPDALALDAQSTYDGAVDVADDGTVVTV